MNRYSRAILATTALAAVAMVFLGPARASTITVTTANQPAAQQQQPELTADQLRFILTQLAVPAPTASGSPGSAFRRPNARTLGQPTGGNQQFLATPYSGVENLTDDRLRSILSQYANSAKLQGSASPNTPNSGGGGSTTTTSASSTTIPSSSKNYLGDKLKWPYPIEAATTPNGDVSNGYCIPASTVLMGAKASFDTSVKSDQTNGGSAAATSAAQWQAVVLGPTGFFNLKKPDTTNPPADHEKVCPDVKTAQTLNPGDPAYISSDNMTNVTYRAGFRYGALVVPFKLQLSGGKAFTGSSSVGGYLGYQNPLGDWGTDITPVLFGGLSNINTSATSGATTTSQTVAGFSYGTGLLFDVKDDFHVGLVLGFDHVSSAQKYQYNDKPWISFEIGYSFAN